jgi:hypothetical protein
LGIVVVHVEEGTHFDDAVAGKPKQVYSLQCQATTGGLKSPPRIAMGSVYCQPTGYPVLFFHYDVHLAVQIRKRRSKHRYKALEWLTPMNGPTGAGSKKLNVVRQNLVRYVESSLAH